MDERGKKRELSGDGHRETEREKWKEVKENGCGQMWRQMEMWSSREKEMR